MAPFTASAASTRVILQLSSPSPHLERPHTQAEQSVTFSPFAGTLVVLPSLMVPLEFAINVELSASMQHALRVTLERLLLSYCSCLQRQAGPGFCHGLSATTASCQPQIRSCRVQHLHPWPKTHLPEPAAPRYEIRNYYHSTNTAHAKVLQNLRVHLGSRATCLVRMMDHQQLTQQPYFAWATANPREMGQGRLELGWMGHLALSTGPSTMRMSGHMSA